MYKDTEELLKKLKLEINPHAKLGSLSIAQMQMVEIAKAVSANCKVLILDEPTSSLTANEVESLFRIMRELKALGVALVYISHKMDEIKVIADEVTIMRDGQYIGKWDVANMTKEQIIAKTPGVRYIMVNTRNTAPSRTGIVRSMRLITYLYIILPPCGSAEGSVSRRGGISAAAALRLYFKA